MTLQWLLLISLAIPLILVARPAQSVTPIQEQLCMTTDAARQAQGARTVLCGFPLPSGAPRDAPDVPLVCHRLVENIQSLLSKEPGLQALTADKICYIRFTEASEIVYLNLDDVSREYKAAPKPVRLLPSVSEIVGISATLVISGGSLSTINPAVFSSIGQAQRERLKYLALLKTNMASIDVSLLEPLSITSLLLISNPVLTRITNNKAVIPRALDELVIWNSTEALADCRNIKSLPSTMSNLVLLQNNIDSCFWCHLPSLATAVKVVSRLPSLPHHPSTVGTDPMVPFPLDRPYGSMVGIPDIESAKEFLVGKAASDCSACRCELWPVEVESSKTSSTGGDTSKDAVQKSSTGTDDPTKSGSRVDASLVAVAAVAALAMAWVQRHDLQAVW